MELREYIPKDELKVKELIDEVTIELKGKKLVKEWENFDDYVLFYVAEDSQASATSALRASYEIIGTAALKDEGDGICKLKRMYVKKEHRGKDIGQRLLYKMLLFAYDEGFKEMRLTVVGETNPAVDFYKKNGFKKIRSPKLNKDFKEMEDEDVDVSNIVCMKRLIN